jgi:Rrf2 family protein
MRLSLQARYAICGLFDLAYNGHGEAVRVREISERQGIPNRYLEQIFQRLRRGGLVTAKRGPGGGYSLSRTPAEIHLLAAIEAVEGPLTLLGGPSADEGATATEGTGGAPVRSGPEFLWGDLASQVGAVLEGVTLEDVCRRAARDAVPRANVAGYEYQI